MSIIHFHYCVNENSGEIRRIRNINKYVAGMLSDSVIELEMYPPKYFSFVRSKGNQFLLSDFVKKKYYRLIINRINWISQWYSSIVVGLLCRRYRPDYIIGEFSSSSRSMHLVKFFSPNTKTIIDVHGASPDEYIYSHGASAKKSIIKCQTYNEKYMSDKMDFIICQSDEMKRHLVRKYNTNPSKITSFKCGVDTNLFSIDESMRNIIRKENNISIDDIVFVYSGGLMKWQKIEESILIYKNFHRNHPQSKFMILTREIEKIHTIINNQKNEDILDSVIVRSLTMEEVPWYLNAADIAFLIRDNDIMNAVASPTKLGEYMACGLPLITTGVAKYWVSENAEEFLINSERSEDLNHDIFNLVKIRRTRIFPWLTSTGHA